MALMRLDKFLSDAGVASRREANGLLKAGRVTVDGAVCRAGETKLDPALASVTVDGQPVSFARNRYFMLNKPLGVITATEDREQKTVLDLLPSELQRLELFPVGRLDKDTTGLLLLTDDGAWAHQVISPKTHVPKVYLAQVDAPLEQDDCLRFSQGIVLADGTRCMPGKLEILEPCRCRVTICEGKYHQVRRMLAACGKHVTALHRQSIGSLELDGELPAGGFKELTASQAKLVFRTDSPKQSL